MANSGDQLIDELFSNAELDEIASTMKLEVAKKIESKEKAIKPLLEINPSIINGIIAIKIKNIQDIIKGVDFAKTNFLCKFLYKFSFTSSNKYYENNIWKCQEFGNVATDGSMWLKVPLFLLSYSLQFTLNIHLIDRLTNITTKEFKSKRYFVQIPSVLIEHNIHKIGDKVQFTVDNASYGLRGQIISFLENDMIEIRTDPRYYPSNTSKDKLLVTKHKSQVFRDVIWRLFVLDLTNIRQSYNDLILRNNHDDQKPFDVFNGLFDAITEIYHQLWLNRKIDFEELDAQFIPNCIAVHIWQCLYTEKYRHRMNCILDGKGIVLKHQWKQEIDESIRCFNEGIDLSSEDVQEIWNGGAYSCDLCLVEVRYFEWMFHCNAKEPKHYFCLSCIHSILQQYYEMQEFLVDLLDGVLNQDIIEEIVAFCVGKVNKFIV